MSYIHISTMPYLLCIHLKSGEIVLEIIYSDTLKQAKAQAKLIDYGSPIIKITQY